MVRRLLQPELLHPQGDECSGCNTYLQSPTQHWHLLQCMDGVERLAQMNEVERMREIFDVVSQSMRKQNDKDRMEMLAMLASTTATETNLMSVNFARRANTQASCC